LGEGGGATPALVNHGGITAAAGATVEFDDQLVSDGALTGGTFAFRGGGATVSGTYSAQATSITQDDTVFTGAVASLGAVDVYHATLDLSGATLADAARTLSSLSLTASSILVTRDDLAVTGPFSWSSSTLQGVAGHGSLTVISDMALSGSYYVRDFNLINAGHATWSGGGVAFFGDTTSSFTNLAGAIFDDQVDGSFGGVHPDCPIFYNEGSFIKSGGTGVTNLDMQLYNSGTVRIDQGILAINCGYVQVVNPGGGSGTIGGPFTGERSINNPGDLESTPTPTPPPPVTNYTQTATGSLTELIGGLAPGTEYGQIVVNGNVNLDGTLGVLLIHGFAPALGNQFIVIDNRGSNAIHGTFANLPDRAALVWAGDYGFSISYCGGDGNDVVLKFVAFRPTATAVWSDWTYDGTAHAATGTIRGIGGADLGAPTSFTYYAGSGTGGTNLGSAAPVATGTYTVVAHYASGGPYIAVDSTPLTITVAKAPLTVTVDDAWRFVGDPNPAFTGTVTGLLSGDDVTVTYGTDADQNSAAGDYAITARLGGSKFANYAATVTPGTLEVVAPASLSGFVYADLNNDGQIDVGENGISGVTVRLRGTDDLGRTIDATTTTDSSGLYQFDRLRHGSYTITEAQPAGYNQGINTVGTAGGTVSGDVFIVSLDTGVAGMNYLYGERPPSGTPLQHGQTAGIGFWNNKNGQALIKSLNGGANSTQLGNWLAANFSHIFGANAGANNLAGKTNAEVATLFQQKFVLKGPKLDAQVMATALSVYVTNQTLAGTAGAAYGFLVTADGAGTAEFKVGPDGTAVARANDTTMTVMEILVATDAMASAGNLYGGDALLRKVAADLYGAINAAGGI
jgi:hypothetical protein